MVDVIFLPPIGAVDPHLLGFLHVEFPGSQKTEEVPIFPNRFHLSIVMTLDK